MTHKDCAIPSSEIYSPLGLGGFKNEKIALSDSDYPDSISNVNKYYCELTGIYHVWKNTSDPIVGICHYRRFFNFKSFKDKIIHIQNVIKKCVL